MKILLVTPVYRYFPDQPQSLWRRSLIKLGHQVKVFPLTHSYLKLINTFWLHRLIRSWQPDAIFFSAGKDAVLPLNQTVFFSGVPFQMLSRSEQQIGLTAKLVVTNDPVHAQDWLHHGAAKAVCLPISAADPDWHRPTHPAKKYHTDVVFIGGLLPDRQRLFLQLLQAGIQLKLFGTLPGIALHPQLQPIYHGPVWGKNIASVYSSCKIALNPVPDHLPTGGNLRTFEIPACGAFQLASRTHPDWFTSGKDIVLYKNSHDLIAKIRYYLNHQSQRRRIASAGYNRTYRDHTYQKRFKFLLRLLAALPSHS